MKPNLKILGYAACGQGTEPLPEARVLPLPPPGTRRRGARLPLLASALAHRARQGEEEEGECQSASVIFGTALGCLTETELFLTQMIQAEEAMPKPRAFSASVHNAIASRVALDLGAQGECQTFVHGEISFAQALFAAGLAQRRRPESQVFVGAVDEASPYVQQALELCGERPAGEGGAVLRCGQGKEGETVLAILRQVAYGRPSSPLQWLEEQFSEQEPEQVFFVPPFVGSSAPEQLPGRIEKLEKKVLQDIHHPSALATATARALAQLSVGPGVMAVVAQSRMRDWACLLLESPRDS